MNVTIETYRGFEIIFNTESERFSFSIDEGSWMEKQSYAACKKNIDDYLKANMDFKPFFARNINGGNTIEIVGIRKDGRFIKKCKDGKLEQLSDYYIKDYILLEEKNEINFATIASLELQIEEIEKKIKEQRSIIISTSVTLEEKKKQLLG